MSRAHIAIRQLLSFALLGALASGLLFAQDMRIPLPKKSKPTPVQKLNQQGVAAVKKHDFGKARKLFYSAYLIDPNDPFTLNNLGFIAEVDGELDRAQRFYALAAENSTEAIVDSSADSSAEGRTVASLVNSGADKTMQVNRINVKAIGLLNQDRAPEADLALQEALKIDASNPFTLNNLGFAKEKQGEIEQALRYYRMAADRNSSEPVVVTVNHSWRGESISKVAGENARKAEKQLSREEDTDTKVARLNLRGVSAINRNERPLARDYFLRAYKLDPANAFTLNNMGYLAELDGDRETAEFFYFKAQDGSRSSARVALATRKDAQGQRVGELATDNDVSMETAQQAAMVARQREGAPIGLRRRDRSFVTEPILPVGVLAAPRRADESEVRIPVPKAQGAFSSSSTQSGQPAATPSKEVKKPLPQSQQPAAEPTQDVIPPLPDEQQPTTEPVPKPPQK
jgi:Flp pilus assembly protein TadD